MTGAVSLAAEAAEPLRCAPVITYDEVMAWLKADWLATGHTNPRTLDMNNPEKCLVSTYLRDRHHRTEGVAPWRVSSFRYTAQVNCDVYRLEEKLANFVWLLTEKDIMTGEEILLTVGEI